MLKLTAADKLDLLEGAYRHVAGTKLTVPLGDNDIVTIGHSVATIASYGYGYGWTMDATDDAGSWLVGALIKFREGRSVNLDSQ